MLRRFNVKNFLSFSEKEDGYSEEFSMIPGKVRNKKDHLIENGKDRLLKFAAIYGANAAGKSNIVKAIYFMRQVVVSGIPNRYTDKYCRTRIENKEKPSYFEVEISLDNKNYTYGFEIILNSKQIISEWLVELDDNGDEKEELFSRDLVYHKYSIAGWKNNEELSNRLDIYMSDICEDDSILFLSSMNIKKGRFYKDFPDARILFEVYYWFDQILQINFPDEPLSDYSYLGQSGNVEEICNLIAAFGTGISDYKMAKVPKETITDDMSEEDRDRFNDIIENMVVKINSEVNRSAKAKLVMRSKVSFFIVTIEKNMEPLYETIRFYHNSKDFSFSLAEESDGTIRLLDLLVVLLNSQNKVYIIDELDRCLHPCLTYKFVEEFLKAIELNKVQLIVTTHESRLLDFDLLRRDEIWFVNKKNDGESDIYSLEEYNTRFDQKIDKAYLEGRYGGVPIFNTIFPIKKSNE